MTDHGKLTERDAGELFDELEALADSFTRVLAWLRDLHG